MLTWKTVIGIAVKGDDLEFVCLKRGLDGVHESGRMTLKDFRHQDGAAYRQFLRTQGLSSANAVVALPRKDVLVRTIALPVEAANNLDQAVSYQVDNLHLYEEGGVYYGYSVWKKDANRIHVAVVMVEKGLAATYYDWFAQAGIPITALTASPAVLYSAASMQEAPMFVLTPQGDSVEILGISQDFLLSRETPHAHLDRELQICRSEMRLPPEAEVRIVQQSDVAYAAALSLVTKAPFSINLLPAEKRVYQSPWTHALTYALAAALLLMGIAFGVRAPLQDYLYQRRLNRAIEPLKARFSYVQKLESKEGRELTRLITLRSFRARTASRLETLVELTRLLPANVSLNDADISDGGVTINGSADSASGLLTILGASRRFRNPEFVSAITKNNEGKEQFRIRMQLAGGGQ